MHFSAKINALPNTIEPLSSSSGIYFDRIGRLKVIKSQLNIVNHVDTSFINPHLSNINEIFSNIRYLCQQTYTHQCDNVLSPLTVRYHDLINEYNSISHLASNRDKRSAWFGGIGTVFKHVFGTLNEDDAIKYDSAIESVQNNEKKVAELMKENILVTTSTMNSYKDIINKLKTNEQVMNMSLNKLIEQISNITGISNILINQTKVHSIFTSLESSLLTLSFILEDLTNAIVLSSQNILHPNIISPAQLYQELANSDRHLPVDTGIPISLSLDNIHILLSISSVTCYYFKEKLVFILHIPLVTNDEFNLYHNLALPTPHKAENPNSFSLILPSNSYTAISNDKSSFCNLDSLDKCKTVNSEFFLCSIPMVLSTSGNPTCESELLTKTMSAIPVQCATKTIVGNLDIWKPLVNNQWIFVQSHSSKVTMDCGTSEIKEIIVFGTGVLHVPYRCTVYTKSTRLISSKDAINISIPVPRLDFNIINDSCCNLDKISNNMSPISLQNIDLDDLTINNKNNKLLPSLNEIINDKPILGKYGTHYFTLTLFIFIIVISFIIFKLYRLIHKYTHKSETKFQVSFTKPTLTEENVNNDSTHDIDDEILHPSPRLKEIV